MSSFPSYRSVIGALLIIVLIIGIVTPADGNSQLPQDGWLEDLREKLGGAKEKSDDAEDEVNAGGGSNPTILDGLITDLENHVSDILDPNTYPSLDPHDAGDVLPYILPTTLEECAEICCDLADEAYFESLNENMDQDYIGSRIQTLETLMDDYRSLAGL